MPIPTGGPPAMPGRRPLDKFAALTKRWTTLNYHQQQTDFWNSPYRFNINHSGRRSGKTEIAKRRLVRKAMLNSNGMGNFICAAPTHLQAKRIYWKDMKALIPHQMKRRQSESELTIELLNGSTIWITGMEKPERVEGDPIDHIILDEYGNMKEGAWYNHVRPGLDTLGRPGTADLIGVPEGRNHYYDMVVENQTDEEWGVFHWFSSEILDPSTIQAARRQMDPLTFEQEYEGGFITFSGLAYYAWNREVHIEKVEYDPAYPLIFCFDFNRAPGAAVIVQEKDVSWKYSENQAKHTTHTHVIGEVAIPKNSTTPIVCERLIQDWGKIHDGPIHIYGDATGGAEGSAKVAGSDWSLVQKTLRKRWSNLKMMVPPSNPRERVRVNAVNSRLMNALGEPRVFVHPLCKRTIRDFEGVVVIEGGPGRLDKGTDINLTHWTDALGYYIAKKHPVLVGGSVRVEARNMAR